jgi:hypothetical protein
MRWLGWIIAAALAWCLYRHWKMLSAAAAASGAGRMRPRMKRTGPLVDPAPGTLGKLLPFGGNSLATDDCGCK